MIYRCDMKLIGAFLVVLFAAGCPNQSRNDSKTLLAEGNKAVGAKQFDAALSHYQKAIEKWSENHYAHYGMGASHGVGRGDWDKAADAFSNAVRIAPDQPMYQLWYGVALYEKAVKTARDEQARKENKKPEEVQVDLGQVNFEKAHQHLSEAIKLNGDMWRAHYYLGKIYRAQDKPKEAATSLSKALQANPREYGPYIALAELYRRWDYTDEAIKVASQGTVNVPGSIEVSDIWFVLGMGYDDKNDWSKAIEAFDKSIEAKRDNHKVKFQRGQAYFKKGDMTNAKRDLEEFSKSGGASLEFAKGQAQKMLMDIAAKSMANERPPEPRMSPEDMVKKGKGKKG
jgi:tetratricopeptide (TPR) repeat protein